jgi:2-polyprenyl-3-methyl-5-hydroxy-6-metoxy-1,4-benzoquinol methylase
MLSICPVAEKVQASATDLPFKRKSFDVVFCANLLHHVEDPKIVINEMIEVARDFLVVVEPNLYNPLMCLFSLLNKSERGLLKLNSKYLAGLVREDKAKRLFFKAEGFVFPNKTPGPLLPIIVKIERFLFPKLYWLFIAKVN